MENGRVTFFVVVNDEHVLARFHPPDTTTVTFLGSLAGGVYSESVRVTPKGNEVEATFLHERLGPEPIRIRVLDVELRGSGDEANWLLGKTRKMGWEMFQLVRTKLRRLGTDMPATRSEK